jgi:hypothetical protein
MNPLSLTARILIPIFTLISFDYASADDRIWIGATVNGKFAHLYFDTGACGITLLSKGATRLDLAFAPPPDFTPDPFRIPLTKTAEYDFEFANEKSKRAFFVAKVPDSVATVEDGSVGWLSELFTNKVISVDSRLGNVAILPTLPPETKKWNSWHIRTNGCILALEIQTSAASTTFVNLDTGSDAGVMLCPKRWRSWQASHTNRASTLNAYYTKGAGLVVAEKAWANKLTIGNLVLQDVPVMEANQADLAMSGDGFEATLGLAALKHLDVILDGKQFVAYVKPSDAANVPYKHNCLGAVFTPEDLVTLRGDYLVARVAPGSPAFLAGIRDGDRLLKYNDHDVVGWQTNAAVIPGFQSSSNLPPVRLTLERGTNTFTVYVIPKPILGSVSDTRPPGQ